jgi:pilus assembly protein Flp/PilA
MPDRRLSTYLQGNLFYLWSTTAAGGGENPMISMYTKLQLALATLFAEEDGQGLTEYALILALIAVIAIAALTLLGGKVTGVLSTVANSL